MRKTLHLACVLALATWPLGHTGAAPRCYPTQRFAVQPGGLVSDTLTNLVWQQQASATDMSWADAQADCSGSGFRLPTLKELGSIVDFTVAYPGPTIDPKAFPSTPIDFYWTSSPVAGASENVWGISFDSGLSNASLSSANHRVRCVR